MEQTRKTDLRLLKHRYHEIKCWIAQHTTQRLLKILGVSMVSSYVPERKLVLIEFVPNFVMKARETYLQDQLKQEITKDMISGKGDKIRKK